MYWPGAKNAVTGKGANKEMELCYTEEKKFTREDVQGLFLSVGWISGEYPARLYRALMNSSAVFTVWDGSRLVGLLRALDDGELVAFLHYLLVRPDYQGRGIVGRLVALAKEKYKDYLYINIMPEESKNAAFYEKHGFRRMEDGVAMQICNFAGRE